MNLEQYMDTSNNNHALPTAFYASQVHNRLLKEIPRLEYDRLGISTDLNEIILVLNDPLKNLIIEIYIETDDISNICCTISHEKTVLESECGSEDKIISLIKGYK